MLMGIILGVQGVHIPYFIKWGMCTPTRLRSPASKEEVKEEREAEGKWYPHFWG